MNIVLSLLRNFLDAFLNFIKYHFDSLYNGDKNAYLVVTYTQIHIYIHSYICAKYEKLSTR